MQILMLIHNAAWHGGTFWRAFPLARALSTKGHDVTLLAGRAKCGLTPIITWRDGVRIIEPPDLAPHRLRHGGMSLMDLAWRQRYVRQHKFDLVHAFSHRPAAFRPARTLRRRHSIPLLLDWSDLYAYPGIAAHRSWPGRIGLGQLDRILETNAVRTADMITAICGPLARRAQDLGVPERRITGLPVGANNHDIPAVSRQQARRELGLPDSAPVVVHTGFAPYDERLLQQTLHELARRNPDIHFLFAGRPRRALLHNGHSQTLIAPQHYHDLGTQPFSRMPTILAAADVALLPYSNCPVNVYRYPNRLGDYLAAGLPVVINRTGDAGELVATRRIGMAVEDSPQAMAHAIGELLAQPETRRQMGALARHLSRTELSWDCLALRLEEAYLRRREDGGRPAAHPRSGSPAPGCRHSQSISTAESAVAPGSKRNWHPIL